MAWTNQPIRLYHGTSRRHAESVVTGIDAKRFAKRKDFGPGFYTTSILVQAEEWAQSKVNEALAPAGGGVEEPAVVEFVIDRDQLGKLETLWFVQPTADYWDLITECRFYQPTVPLHGRKAGRPYDVVVGPVASRWKREPYVAFTEWDQISFHTAQAFKLLDGSGRILSKEDASI